MAIGEILDTSWREIFSVQKQSYREDLLEEVDVLKGRWRVSPDTCFVFKGRDNSVLGYILAYPWKLNNPPKLSDNLTELFSETKNVSDPFVANTLYLHDLAVSTDARGLGVGKQLINKILKVAKLQNFKRIMLVAVDGADSFWFNFGFREVERDFSCPTYGDDAKLMTLQLTT